MARLTLIAHAATEAQRHAAFPKDEPVVEREIAKIAGLGWNAPQAQSIWSGPELRTQQTAHALGLSAAVSVELRDCDSGIWRGRAIDEVQTDDPQGVIAWMTDPTASPHGGESIEHLIARTGRWMEEQLDANHTIAVTHPAVIRGAIVYALRLPAQIFWRIDITPLSFTDLRFNGGVWTVRCTSCSL